MDLDNTLLVNIVLLLHFILTGIMLFRLFKIKNATGKHVIISLLVLVIPILGPFVLITYFNKQIKKQENQESKKSIPTFTYKKNKKR